MTETNAAVLYNRRARALSYLVKHTRLLHRVQLFIVVRLVDVMGPKGRRSVWKVQKLGNLSSGAAVSHQISSLIRKRDSGYNCELW